MFTTWIKFETILLTEKFYKYSIYYFFALPLNYSLDHNILLYKPDKFDFLMMLISIIWKKKKKTTWSPIIFSEQSLKKVGILNEWKCYISIKLLVFREINTIFLKYFFNTLKFDESFSFQSGRLRINWRKSNQEPINIYVIYFTLIKLLSYTLQ